MGINRTRQLDPRQAARPVAPRVRPLPQERRTLSEVRRLKPTVPPFVVPRLFPGGTVVCCASGPSLLREDVEYAHSKGVPIIAVNDAVQYAPFAVALMASDAAWWIHRKPEFAGMRFSLDPGAVRVEGVVALRRTGDQGLETDPTGLKSGRNSGAAAINLAAHFIGAGGRVLLLGYDMGAKDERHSHFFGAHKFPLRGHSPYAHFRHVMEHMVEPLKQLRIEVWNCSRHTELKCFPRKPLHEALP